LISKQDEGSILSTSTLREAVEAVSQHTTDKGGYIEKGFIVDVDKTRLNQKS
jgi:hypothetical protein